MILVRREQDPQHIHAMVYEDGSYEWAYPELHDDPFTDEDVHPWDLPDRVAKCATCPAELRELDQVHFVAYPLVMCFQCSMILLHLRGAAAETRVHVSLDLLRRLRDVEFLDSLTGEPVQVHHNMNGTD